MYVASTSLKHTDGRSDRAVHGGLLYGRRPASDGSRSPERVSWRSDCGVHLWPDGTPQARRQGTQAAVRRRRGAVDWFLRSVVKGGHCGGGDGKFMWMYFWACVWARLRVFCSSLFYSVAFYSILQVVVKNHGCCLLPVFALGRAQELLLLLDEHWQKSSHLQEVPVYYASGISAKVFDATVEHRRHSPLRRLVSLYLWVSHSSFLSSFFPFILPLCVRRLASHFSCLRSSSSCHSNLRSFKCSQAIRVYQTYVNMMNDHIRSRQLEEPFKFRHIQVSLWFFMNNFRTWIIFRNEYFFSAVVSVCVSICVNFSWRHFCFLLLTSPFLLLLRQFSSLFWFIVCYLGGGYSLT